MNAIIYGPGNINGKISVSGAKNSATRLLAASLICDGRVTLKNYPLFIVDSIEIVSYLKLFGVSFEENYLNEEIIINPKNLGGTFFNQQKLPVRITYLLAAGFLKREGEAKIPYPGGCKIGSRGYDLHIRVWENMGCNVTEEKEFIWIKANKKLKPIDIQFPISTTGGTENALICASIIEGESHIRNAYISPEVWDLINFLKATGVSIDVVGNSYIRVIGKSFHQGVNFSVMPDRIEALTWLILAGVSEGSLIVKNVPFSSMEVPLLHLKEAGLEVFKNTADAFVCPESIVNGEIQPFELACGTYPGVISDMQPFFVLLALKANGISRVYDYRYPERINYLNELSKLCPNALSWEAGKITIKGPVRFNGGKVKSTDLRGSMALVMAGILADTPTIIKDFEIALRGYNDLEMKLKAIGVQIETKNNS